MTEKEIDREVERRLAIFNHAEEVTGNVAMTCRYYGINRQTFYTWKRRYEELGEEGSDPAQTSEDQPMPPTSTLWARSSTSARTTTSGRRRSRCT